MTKKMWGGRFIKKMNPVAEEFTKSIRYDYKLARYDLIGSMMHVSILARVGYLKSSEASKLLNGLEEIYAKVEKGSFGPDLREEDIHTQIQNVLQDKVGDIALKLHTARSRNDQVVFATKLYCKDNILKIRKKIWNVANAISLLADKNMDVVIPGYTHLRRAQPVYLKDYLRTYTEMLGRDDKRLGDINGNMKITIGAGALAGTPIHSREYGSSPWSLLKKKGLMDLKDALNLQMTENSIDAVSDRDFVIEIISALSIAAMHLSRLAEDFIIWSTKEFDLLDIDESFCTGSSLMPHKKNPDSLELIRGYSGRIYGNLVSVLTMMKGLPLAYNRDMQLDKEPLFDSFEILGMELEILKDLIATLKFNENAIGPALRDESLYTTDIVYYLVDKGVPFKSAHTIVGKIVRHSSESGIPIKDMSEGRLKRFSARIVKNEILRLFDPHLSVRSKRSVNRAKR